MDEATLNTIVLAVATMIGAVVTAFSVAFVIWTYNDMKARSRDPLAQVAAAILVAILNIFGLIIYIMLRPRETLADAYERSLEEEALLQEIEEKPACPGCGRPTKHDWQVCPYCHTRLKKVCFNCHSLLELSWNLCPACATVQEAPDADHDALASHTAQAAPRPRRSNRQIKTSPYDVGDSNMSLPPTASRSVQNDSLEWVDSE